MFIPKNLGDLKRIIEERIEETARLEFKRQLPDPGKNDDLAQDLSAMANAEGGVILYGVEEDDMGRAKALYPFPVRDAAERVNLVAQSRLDEPLALGSVYTIPSEDRQGYGFLVVEVPRSERAPHFFQGAAWGRTFKGKTPLTRRKVGELFARSPAFAEEFGLVIGRPGRVLVKHVAEPYQETDRDGRLRTKQRYYLVFENDGEADVLDAAWEWVTVDEAEEALPSVSEDPFPLELLQAGVQVRVQVFHTMGEASGLKVRTHWRDRNGNQHEQTWPMTW